MESAVANNKIPLAERINVRMVVVIAVVLFLVGYPVYTFVKQTMNGGVEKVGDLNRVDLKALGNFPFDENNGTLNDVPERYRELDGKKVVLQGFPFPTRYSADEVPEFQFVYNIQKCCFGGPPRVQRVFAHAPGKLVPFYASQFATLEGTLHVRPVKDGDKIVSLYDLQIDRVEPAQQRVAQSDERRVYSEEGAPLV